ncbi:MAG: hypothetical protein MJ052_06110, partial [Sphaerochaetaceae bacterium]|nr:hypothetical protein [Sphaerochaetaceae bacterium]
TVSGCAEKRWALLLCCVVVLCLCSCRTAQMIARQSDLREVLLSGETEEADALVESSGEKYNDDLVFAMDAGWINYYNGDYDNAIRFFTAAENLAEARKPKSIKNFIGTLAIGANASDFSATDYEHIFINIGLALSYYGKGEPDEVFVEIRKIDSKLTDYALNAKDKNSVLEELMTLEVSDPYNWKDGEGRTGSFTPPEEAEQYTFSPFASYLSMLFYRAEGDVSNSEIDFKRLAAISRFTPDADDVKVPQGKARVTVVSVEGLIPQKHDESVMARTMLPPLKYKDQNGKQVCVPGLPYSHKVAWSVLPEHSVSDIVRTTVRCSDGSSVEETVIEDVALAAKKSLSVNTESEFLKSYYRGYTRLKTSWFGIARVYAEMKKKSPALAFAFLVSSLNAVNKSEKADLRLGSFLPGNIKCAGMTLEPGVYDFTVEYLMSDGTSVTRVFSGVKVREKGLNLIVSECIK